MSGAVETTERRTVMRGHRELDAYRGRRSVKRRALLSTLLLVTCTIRAFGDQGQHGGSQSPEQPVGWLQARLSVEGEGVCSENNHGDCHLEARVIRGSLFGAAENDYVFDGELISGEYLGVPLGQIEDRVRSAALPLALDGTTGRLSVSPSSARIARIAFFARRGSDRNFVTDFLESSSGVQLILVYFDQPCDVSGEVTLDAVQYHIRARPTRKGFYWLRATPKSRTEIAVESSGTQPEGIVMRVRPHVTAPRKQVST